MGSLRGRFITAMQARNLAGQSQRSYVRAVKQLSDYYEINPAKLTQTQIQHFILHLANEKKLCWDSCNAYTSGIRFFYKVVLGKNLGDFYIPLAKTAKKIPDILPRTEIEELFAHVTLDKYRLMFMIMYSAGLRISEVVKLIASYIDSSEGVIVVRAGKGNKDRYAPLSNQVLIELRKYWKKYRPVSCLFPSRRTQKPISPRTVRFYFAKALAQTTIKKQVSTHSLRHSFATHLLEAGTNIINIKQCLGHALLSSTLRYARFSKPIIANVGFPFDK